MAVDLFCGAGGASRGLHDAGYDVVGFYHWQPAVDTHNANGMPAHLHDLSDPSHDHLIPACDLLWASPPCQPFSAAGNSDGENDDRDGFPWALRIIARLLPPVVIIENVKGLTFDTHRDYFAGILAGIAVLGYDVRWRVLNAADHGVPQTRERCFIVARRDGGPIGWPQTTHTEQAGLFTEPWVTMADALGWGFGLRPSFTVAVGHAEPFAPSSRRVMLDYRQNAPRTGEPILCDVTDRPSPTVGVQSVSRSGFSPARPRRSDRQQDQSGTPGRQRRLSDSCSEARGGKPTTGGDRMSSRYAPHPTKRVVLTFEGVAT